MAKAFTVRGSLYGLPYRTCALIRYSPYSLRSPVEGLRVKHTPVPLVGPMLPNAMAWGQGGSGYAGGRIKADTTAATRGLSTAKGVRGVRTWS